MNIDWLYSQNASECIIFCNGWGMDSHAVRHIQSNEYDVCMISNYDSFQNPLPNFETYTKLHLVAWSMGVWAANQIFGNSSLVFDSKTAINGTECPMHNTFGINTSVFLGTLESWNDETKIRFNTRMCGGKKGYAHMKQYMSKRSEEDQKKELHEIYTHLTKNYVPKNFNWTQVIIGEHDMIFTTENQKNYWSKHTNSITLPIPHFPFHQIGTWRDILDMIL